MLFSVLTVLLALALDYKYAEVSRHHPLVYFGHLASVLERCFNRVKGSEFYGVAGKALGVISWTLAVMPLVLLSGYLEYLFESYFVLSWLFAGATLYIAVGWRSLLAHAQAISMPLKNGDIGAARGAVSMIVSRDTQSLNESQIANAASESVLENGADAIFAAIFWFLLLGVPGVVLYRLANTLDAMWGYKHSRYLHFGWAAARIDDLLNFIPARLVALSYALLGNYKCAIESWKLQGVNWKSPNAGPVMSAGAGALNLKLGGGSIYQGQWQDRSLLGPSTGTDPTATAVDACCLLVNRVLLLWVFVLISLVLLF